MSIIQYWGLLWGFKALAEQQDDIGRQLFEQQQRMMTAQQRRDIEEQLWDYSARLHLRLAEELPELDKKRIAKVATQLAVELLELDKLETANPFAN